ncbi:MAG TPA: peptidase C25, partial [Thermoplasmatales archaeon]|nr:peptidase C25 [Thermoplasmatales archaeon]
MRSKVMILVLVNVLLLSGVAAGGVTHEASGNPGVNRMVKTSVVNIPPLSLKDLSNGYVELHMKGVSSYLLKPGYPELPMVVETFELPFGVKNVEVSFTPKDVVEQVVAKKIKPSPPMLPLVFEGNGALENGENKEVYGSVEVFPSTWYTYRVGCGLNKEMKRVTFVNVHIYPVRYSPGLNELYVMSEANLSISFDKPKTSFFPRNTEYDMVVIAPSVFSDALQPLVEHKNNHNIKTVLKTTEDIYDEYPGVDKPEKIKYFIKDAIEKWNITYVLLVGGLKKFIWANGRDDCNQGSKDWFLPVRYSNIFDNPKYPLSDESDLHDPGVISDLYYADVYREGGVFESWDPNHDGVFLAWNKPGVENDTGVDFYPDVALGRLACRSVKEVKTVVNKIINYESKPCDPSWFKRMLVVSGDGFLDQKDLNIQWDTSSLPDGFYRVYAQSFNPGHESGPIEIINITLDRTVETHLTFN